MHGWIDRCMDEWMDSWIAPWMDSWMDGWMPRSVGRWITKRKMGEGQMSEMVNKRGKEWTDGWKEGQLTSFSCCPVQEPCNAGSDSLQSSPHTPWASSDRDSIFIF
jgi:hypothetical protein